MTNDKMREEFKAWAATKGMGMHLAHGESGLYVSRVTQNYMDCWMASRVGQAALVEALTSQVKALQSDANSYQSGYDAGCAAAKAHADSWRAEAEKLRKERDQLAEDKRGLLEDFGGLL
jgi:cell division septum initiation protein DivIVA